MATYLWIQKKFIMGLDSVSNCSKPSILIRQLDNIMKKSIYFKGDKIAFDAFKRMLVKSKKVGSCIEYQGNRNFKGYGILAISRTQFRAHRVAYEYEKGGIPEGHLVCHSCDNPACININHLFLGTDSDNIKDMYSKGRGNKEDGKHAAACKMNIFTVRSIRKHSFLPVAENARLHNVTYGQVYSVVKCLTWRGVE